MKLIQSFTFIFVIALLFTSCGTTPDKVLPRFGGDWDLTSVRTVTTVAGTQTNDNTIYDQGTMSFVNDGTGTAVADGQTSSFDWSYDDATETLSFTADGNTTEFEVLETTGKAQMWYNKTEFTLLGVTTASEQYWNLDKQ